MLTEQLELTLKRKRNMTVESRILNSHTIYIAKDEWTPLTNQRISNRKSDKIYACIKEKYIKKKHKKIELQLYIGLDICRLLKLEHCSRIGVTTNNSDPSVIKIKKGYTEAATFKLSYLPRKQVARVAFHLLSPNGYKETSTRELEFQGANDGGLIICLKRLKEEL